MRGRFPNVATTTEKAFEIYHNSPMLRTVDIENLFDCSRSTAIKIKKMAKLEMLDRGIKLYSEHDNVVDRDTVLELAGIDIKAVNKSYQMLKKYSVWKNEEKNEERR